MWKIDELFKNDVFKNHFYWFEIKNFKSFFKKKIIKVIENYENSSDNQKNAHLVGLFKKNIKVEQCSELVDLCPLYFSKVELLSQLNDEWFQKTGVVSVYFKALKIR